MHKNNWNKLIRNKIEKQNKWRKELKKRAIRKLGPKLKTK